MQAQIKQDSTAVSRAIWSAGSYADVGARLQIVGETACEFAALEAQEDVLDVAAGNGNFSLAAARRFARVTSTDLVPSLVEKTRIRSLANEMNIDCHVANAEALPFEDYTFDLVASVFGVMFVGDHQNAASELARVCRTDGRIIIAAWTPDSFVGRLFAILSQFKEKSSTPSPLQWGTTEYLEKLFPTSQALRTQTETYHFHYATAATWVDYFTKAYGPLNKTVENLAAADAERLKHAILDLATEMNRGRQSLVVPSKYLLAEISFNKVSST